MRKNTWKLAVPALGLVAALGVLASGAFGSAGDLPAPGGLTPFTERGERTVAADAAAVNMHSWRQTDDGRTGSVVRP